MVTLSTSSPLLISPSDPICGVLSHRYHPALEAAPPGTPSKTLPKVQYRSVVALASGHALEYIRKLKQDPQWHGNYSVVNDQVLACIKMLLDHPQPVTWLHCDAIALGFCSNLLLQQAQVHALTRLAESSSNYEAIQKARLALLFGRRLAWDMVVVALGKIESKSEVAKLPFAALCCVARAGMAVLETSGLSDENLASAEDIKRLQRVVSWLSARWSVGRQFEARLVDITRDWSL